MKERSRENFLIGGLLGLIPGIRPQFALGTFSTVISLLA
jgi:hypothetical protein